LTKDTAVQDALGWGFFHPMGSQGRGIVKGAIAFVCLFSMFTSVGFSYAQDDVRSWGDDLLNSRKKIEGVWKEKQNWKGWLCEGSYQYHVDLAADIEKVDFDITDKGFLVVTADIKDIFAKANGVYRSSATMCLPTGGWLGATVPWAKLKTEVHFGDSGDMKDIRLKIISTELGRVQLGKMFPVWFEDFFTGVMNRALTVVWNSKMGDWVSGMITEEAKRRMP
jgi:hypothetical protein